MADFAGRTGLAPPERDSRRYLWTDAFAVCNFLAIFRHTGDKAWHHLALHLVDEVHRVLGRHRPDDGRRGWISGLDEAEGLEHPTAGGLRIGKPRRERALDEPLDESLEWDRDGQYFHYSTKWMHALHQASRWTGEPIYLRWAIELAKASFASFAYPSRWSGRKRMYWKMRVDLSAPLVDAMGQHDPLDGLVTFCQLQEAAKQMQLPAAPDLSSAIEELRSICRGADWTTGDPLGVGGLLFDACRVAQLPAAGAFLPEGLFSELLDSALASLDICTRAAPWRLPASYRLPFRELGMAVGLEGMEMIGRDGLPARNCPVSFDRLRQYSPWAENIKRFWLVDANREFAGWRDHRDINAVMLATVLMPEGFLRLDPQG